MPYKFRATLSGCLRSELFNTKGGRSLDLKSSFYSTLPQQQGEDDISRKPSLNHFNLSSLSHFQDPTRSPKPFTSSFQSSDTLHHFQNPNNHIDRNTTANIETNHEPIKHDYVALCFVLFCLGTCLGSVIGNHALDYSMNMTSTQQVPNIPPEIKQCIEDILLAEERGDLQLSVQHCQRAMLLFDNTGSSPAFLHYSGIVIKLAQIYEQLNDLDKAVSIYKEVSEFYVSNLIEFDDKTTAKFSQYDFMISLLLTSTTRYYLLASEADKEQAGNLLGFSIVKSLMRFYNLNPLSMFYITPSINHVMNELCDYPIIRLHLTPRIKLLNYLYKKTQMLGGLQEKKFLMCFQGNFPIFTSNLAFALDIFRDSLIDEGKPYLAVPLLLFSSPLYRHGTDDLLRQAMYRFKTGDGLLRLKLDVKAGRLPRAKLSDVSERILRENTAIPRLKSAGRCATKLYQNSRNEHRDIATKIMIYSLVDLGINFILNKQPVKAKTFLLEAKEFAKAYPYKDELKDVYRTIDDLLKDI